MRWLLCALVSSCLLAESSLNVFNQSWTVPNAADWSITQDGAASVLHLLVGREPLPGPRRPFQFALAEMKPARKLIVEADAMPLKRSLIIVYAYRDASHFDYAHFSTDSAGKQPVHNGVFHVYGGERVRISSTDGPPAFPAINRWFHIKLVWDGATGSVQGYVDGQAVPALHAVDLSLSEGRVGIGSFDETADFKNVKISAD
jgi:hypothetical protein